MEYRFQYLRESNGQNVGCVAIRLRTNGRSTSIDYQVSVLNPLDRFNRAVSRQLALGRLIEQPTTVVSSWRNPTMYEISLAVMEDIVNNSSIPTRARKAARLWVRNNPMNFEIEIR